MAAYKLESAIMNGHKDLLSGDCPYMRMILEHNEGVIDSNCFTKIPIILIGQTSGKFKIELMFSINAGQEYRAHTIT